MREVLKNLGLTDNEVDVYLALLELEDVGISKIAARSGLHRQVCYDVLDRLVEKGYVTYVLQNGKKHFNAASPEKILDLLDKEREELKNIMPQLMEKTSKRGQEVSVEIIKGKSVLKTILNDIYRVMRKSGGPLLVMGVDETKFLKFDEQAIIQHIRLLRKHKMKEHLLSKKTAKYFFQGSQSVYRFLPEHMFNPNPTQIYGDKVAIVIWGNPVYGIIIKSKQMADAHRKYFKLLWGMAKKA